MNKDKTETDDHGSVDRDKKPETPEKPETMEQQARRRITAAVAREIQFLETYAAKAGKTGDTPSFVQAMEVIASIKAKVEVYCLQIEMAVKTATMATMIGGMFKGGEGAGGIVPVPGEQHGTEMQDLISKVSRPGHRSAEPSPVRDQSKPHPPEDGGEQ